MLYEVITSTAVMSAVPGLSILSVNAVITSYSIHYTKLYEPRFRMTQYSQREGLSNPIIQILGFHRGEPLVHEDDLEREPTLELGRELQGGGAGLADRAVGIIGDADDEQMWLPLADQLAELRP